MDIYNNLLQVKYLLYSTRKYLRGKDIVCLILSTFSINILSLAFPIMLLQIYDRVIPNVAIYTLFLLLIGVTTALLIESILRIASALITAWVDARLEFLMGNEIFNKILNAEITAYEKEGAGFYLEHLNSINILKDFYTNQIISSLIDLPFVFIFIALLFYIGKMIVFVPLVLLLVLFISADKLNLSLNDAICEKRSSDNKMTNFIISMFLGIHSIKSMALETQMLRRFERVHEMGCHHDYQLGSLSHLALLISSSALQLTTVLVLVFGSLKVIHGGLTIGGLAACVILASRILQPVSRVIGVLSRLQSVKIAERNLKKLQSLPQESVELKDFSLIKGEITLENVSFRYNENQPWIFKNLHLKIKCGEIIGIHSNALTGKSSLLYLMLGILKPTEGRVLIDGNDIQKFNQESLRRQISCIPQHGALFNGTILENITMFRPLYIDKAKKIAEILGLTSDIHQLPRGFDTQVGKLSVESLPYGLKQRICIARALVEEPRIILFDESNASFDKRSDEMLKQVLLQYGKHRTWVIVSHRPSMLELTNRIYELVDGNINETRQYEPKFI